MVAAAESVVVAGFPESVDPILETLEEISFYLPSISRAAKHRWRGIQMQRPVGRHSHKTVSKGRVFAPHTSAIGLKIRVWRPGPLGPNRKDTIFVHIQSHGDTDLM